MFFPVVHRSADASLTDDLADDPHGAFPGLMSGLAGPVYSLALRLCGREAAEDVTQEAFVRAYRALHDYEPERRRALQVRPWLLTIALNVARNHVRTEVRNPRGDNTGLVDRPDPAPGPDAAAQRGDVQARLASALHRLPVPMREAVVLRHIAGCATAEAATILGRPVGTVKAQVSRGLAALRVDLEIEGLTREDT
ncbi:MAG: sigma-70 family RNA polymerase sigma factor [Actinobacteria bacterium]|nr:sigma-70 family RNA polymerase sigma factor [Actinomycetota bacterium]